MRSAWCPGTARGGATGSELGPAAAGEGGDDLAGLLGVGVMAGALRALRAAEARAGRGEVGGEVGGEATLASAAVCLRRVVCLLAADGGASGLLTACCLRVLITAEGSQWLRPIWGLGGGRGSAAKRRCTVGGVGEMQRDALHGI